MGEITNNKLIAEIKEIIINSRQKEGQPLSEPDDILKEPYVFEFLDI